MRMILINGKLYNIKNKLKAHKQQKERHRFALNIL
jgi:hypothetical protein